MADWDTPQWPQWPDSKRELEQRTAPSLRPSVGDEIVFPMTGDTSVEFDHGLTYRQYCLAQALAGPLANGPNAASTVDRIFGVVDAMLARLDDERAGR